MKITVEVSKHRLQALTEALTANEYSFTIDESPTASQPIMSVEEINKLAEERYPHNEFADNAQKHIDTLKRSVFVNAFYQGFIHPSKPTASQEPSQVSEHPLDAIKQSRKPHTPFAPIGVDLYKVISDKINSIEDVSLRNRLHHSKDFLKLHIGELPLPVQVERGKSMEDWDKNNVIQVAEKLYYEANENTKMDVPSYAYEQVEKANHRRIAAILNLYDWCKLEQSTSLHSPSATPVSKGDEEWITTDKYTGFKVIDDYKKLKTNKQ